MTWYERHILPHLIDLSMRNSRLADYRERVLSRAEGRVLEIGIGSGRNLSLYTDRATEILGLDPNRRLLAMARARQPSLSRNLVEGLAGSVPLETASVDTVVTTWTLCSIPGVESALAEMRRVLKPGGQLLFVEHGLSPDLPVRRWQQRLTPAWKRLAGGCHLDRPIQALIEDAGALADELHGGATADDLHVRRLRTAAVGLTQCNFFQEKPSGVVGPKGLLLCRERSWTGIARAGVPERCRRETE
jgi:SAM-dependent methyltransferase